MGGHTAAEPGANHDEVEIEVVALRANLPGGSRLRSTQLIA
jgi:hypothetical protein